MMEFHIHVHAFDSSWFKDCLEPIEEWWGIPFIWSYEDISGVPIEYLPWDNLNVLSDDFIRRYQNLLAVRPSENQKEIMNMMVVPLSTTPTFLGLCRSWDNTLEIFENEKDHIYILGKDMGPAGIHMGIHELSHLLYSLLKIPDNTHRYFFAATPELARAEILTNLGLIN